MPNSPNNPEPIDPEANNPESTDPESLPTRQPGSEQSPTIDDQDTGETSDLTGGYAAGVALGPIAILAGTFITNRLKGESAAQ